MSKRFKKGSIEAKKFMAKIRKAKGKGKAPKVKKSSKKTKALGSKAPITKVENILSFIPKVITESQILKEINKIKDEILHLVELQKEHTFKAHKKGLGGLVKLKHKEIATLLKKCK